MFYTGGMQRINVIGPAGAGKSTLGAALAARLQTPLAELDELFWRPDWQQAPLDEFRALVVAAVAPERWVVVGNYSSKVRDIVWGRADTVVWLDYGLPLVLYRLHRRTWRRVVTQEELWGGNRETWRGQYWSRDSLYWWVLRNHGRQRRGVQELLARGEYPHLEVLRFHTPRAAQAWLQTISFA